MTEDSPDLRVSDADRERVAKLLREHFAQGRLDDDEFNTRLESAYKARTRGELVPLFRDLPEMDLGSLPAEAPRPPAAGNRMDPALVIPWLVWAGVNALCFTIWLIPYLTGAGTAYPWFLWVAGPWGVVLLFISIGVIVLKEGRQGRAD
ncbi:DUF1707 SHOCT-like domain-containing protein [Allosalinactinospora lopnorensis]|uniref:DUF1707 SHOCT-like domain-containing protein n=1 Tax=Allosalinactinospora lopnorensis TaxID=1352348 RepID=UPI000623D2F2|nr:DUF1707 domain-containing protein [Allosalinactinospora lopnorensis]